MRHPQAETIAFPEVEPLLRSHLLPLLDVPVHTNRPGTLPDSFVLLRRTGGPRIGLVVDQPMLTIECWAKTVPAASALATTVRAHINATPGRLGRVNRVQEFSGPALLPAPEAPNHVRYSWTVALDVRGHAI